MEKCIVLLGVILISVYNQAVVPEKTTQVEVRAVLVNCEPDIHGPSVAFDNDATRFEREELFKHSVLKDCTKKIGITVKITSDPSQNSGDEYIPIEHVFQGVKRVRLLNPYVMRLRRELPIQAYKLRKIDTVSGTLVKEMAFHDGMKLDLEVPDASNVQNLTNNSRQSSHNFLSYENFNEQCISRKKRQETNIEGSSKTVCKASQNIPKDSFDSGHDLDEKMTVDDGTTHSTVFDESLIDESVHFDDTTQPDELRVDDYKPITGEIVSFKTKKREPDEARTITDLSGLEEPNASNQIKAEKQMISEEIIYDKGKEYDMFEIGNADIWYTVQVQLFEKVSNPNGMTTWNDLTKGKPARISSLSPEWTGQDMSIAYKSSEWIPREEFSLPVTSMCLLAPVCNKPAANLKPADPVADQYILVPHEDVLDQSSDENDTKKREDHLSESHEQSLRRVVIRTSRAIFGGVNDKLNIVSKNGDKFLSLVHKQPYHAQIELECRADDNQLVHVGIVTRECIPEIPELLNERENNSPADGFIIVPPKHTQSILLDVPTEIPVDVAHCSMVLINGDHQLVAVRDLTIRKGDRCFCVWHCECVCLGEDPKLMCREMAESRQLAAGLSLRESTRHVRSVCYPNVISLNLFFAASGVIAFLMFFGLMKACLGLVSRCIGTWGLAHVLQMPRKLDHYYEPTLHNRKVIYDDEGWPIHPDTMERSVRLISVPMEFALNIIFFVIAPCIIIFDALKQMCNRYKKSDCSDNSGRLNNNTKTKKCFSSRDMQSSNMHWRRRRWRLQRWMTPEAQQLTSNVMQDGIPNRASMIRHTMRPLLRENLSRGDEAGQHVACGDSELEDTEYVLTQMQKSRESLARSQRKLNGAVATMTKRQ